MMMLGSAGCCIDTAFESLKLLKLQAQGKCMKFAKDDAVVLKGRDGEAQVHWVEVL